MKDVSSRPRMFAVWQVVARYATRPADPRGDCAFVAFSAVTQLLVFLFLVVLFGGGGIAEEEESHMYVLFFALAPLLSVAGYRWWVRIFTAARIKFVNVLVVAVPLGIVLFGLSHIGHLIYFTYEAPAPEVPLSVPRFVSGVLLYAVMAYVMFRSSRHRERPLNGQEETVSTVAKVVGIVLIASLYDVYMMIDTLSLSPYAAPALLVANGHIPLVNVFSQYGLNFLIFSFAFAILPTSLFTMAAIVGVLNIVMYMVFVAIAVNIARNKRTVFVAAICVVLFVHSAHLYNINYTPSVLAMRFLPPLVLVLSLTLLPPEGLFSRFSAVCLGLCALWSIEALMFGAMTYGAYVLLCCLGRGCSAAHLARCLLGIAGIVALPHIVLCLSFMAILGVRPDYGTYLQLVFFHLSGGPYWKLLIEPDLRVWSLFGFGYATALAVAAHIALRRMRDKQEFSSSVAVIGAVALLGMLMFYYYIGRSATPILTFISLPLLLVAIATIDWSICEMRTWHAEEQPVPALAPIALAMAVICFPLLGGVFADKFFRPFSQHLSNSSILRNWTQTPIGKTVRVRERIRTMKRTTAGNDRYPDNEAGGSLSYTHAENRAAFELIRALGTEGQEILMFIADPVPVLFHTPRHRLESIAYPPHRVGVAYPSVDGLSATLTERALSAVEVVKADSIVVVGELPRPPLDEKALEKLREKWILCQVPAASKVMVYRLRPKLDSGCH